MFKSQGGEYKEYMRKIVIIKKFNTFSIFIILLILHVLIDRYLFHNNCKINL